MGFALALLGRRCTALALAGVGGRGARRRGVHLLVSRPDKAAMAMASQGWHRQCQGSQGAGGIARVNEHGALPKSGRRPRGACHRGWTSARVTRFAEPRDSESPGARGSVSRPSSELGQAVSFTSPRITPEEVRQRPELSLPPPPSNPPSSLPRGVCPGQAAREGRPHAPNKSRRP